MNKRIIIHRISAFFAALCMLLSTFLGSGAVSYAEAGEGMERVEMVAGEEEASAGESVAVLDEKAALTKDSGKEEIADDSSVAEKSAGADAEKDTGKAEGSEGKTGEVSSEDGITEGEKSTEGTPTKETSAGETSSEGASSEGTLGEGAPTDGSSAEASSVEGASVEKKPTGENSTEGTLTEDTSDEGTPSEETLGEETSPSDDPSEEKSEEESSAPAADLLPPVIEKLLPFIEGMEDAEDISEDTAFSEDVPIRLRVTDPEEGLSSGLQEISWQVLCDGKETDSGTIDLRAENPDEVIGNFEQAQAFTVSAEANNSNDVLVRVTARDCAGNETSSELPLKIDSTPPVVMASFEPSAPSNGSYFYEGRTLIVTVRERNFDPALVGIRAVCTEGVSVPEAGAWTKAEAENDGKEADGEDAEGKETDGEDTGGIETTEQDGKETTGIETTEKDGEETAGEEETGKEGSEEKDAEEDDPVYTTAFHFSEEGTYSDLQIFCTDAAGNEAGPAEFPDGQPCTAHFSIDLQAPTALSVSYPAPVYTETEGAVHRFYYPSAVSVGVTFTETAKGSGISYVSLRLPGQEQEIILREEELPAPEMTEDGRKIYRLGAPFGDAICSSRLTIPVNTEGSVQLRVVEKSGREAALEETVRVISDNIAPSASITLGAFGRSENGAVWDHLLSSYAFSLFSARLLPLTIRSQDERAGILKVEYLLSKEPLAYEALLQRRDWQAGTPGHFTVPLREEGPVIAWVRVTDKAGNLRYLSSDGVVLDTTPPRVVVSYDNNRMLQSRYFKEARTALITVYETNFDPARVQINAASTGGIQASLSGWERVDTPDGIEAGIWQTRAAFREDGEYHFGVTMTDAAGNEPAAVVFENGTVAGEHFIIDREKAGISIAFDPKTPGKDGFYREARTAVLTVDEENFDPGRVTVSLQRTLDGKRAAAPIVSGWTAEGTKHTAVLRFIEDGDYSLAVSFTDLAGNVSHLPETVRFTVDRTAPEIAISGVRDRSANAGAVRPVIRFSDRNLSAESFSVQLFGANRKEIEAAGSTKLEDGVLVFTMPDMERLRENDDIYMLRAEVSDAAGNRTEKTIRFSVNRFGSVYALSDETERLNHEWRTEGAGIQLSEINADQLRNIRVTVFKNNETVVLREGVDYTVDSEGGNGAWYRYSYTVSPDCFRDDAVYRVVFHSEDAAGNISENTMQSKGAEILFGVDRTAPAVAILNLESGKSYAENERTVLFSASDNLMLYSLQVYLDGGETPFVSFGEEEIRRMLEESPTFQFELRGGGREKRSVRIVASDRAGNISEDLVEDFTLRNSVFVRLINNWRLFYGLLGGFAAVSSGIIVLLILMRRRRKKGEKTSG